MSYIDNLQWRYATKMFNPNKKIQQEDVDEIVEAFRLTPSGFGLQPWTLISVENPQIRGTLLPCSWGQKQVVDASHLFVFARKENMSDTDVEKYIDAVSTTTNKDKTELEGYASMMKGFLSGLSLQERNAWADRQVMIAVGNVLSFLAEKHIDSCPMEGFDKAKYDEILGLKDKGLSSVLVLPVGYASEEDEYAQSPKVRFDVQDVFLIQA